MYKVLSKYKTMWLFVMFDLPVKHKYERKIYNNFRNKLLEHGFMRAQYSVYIKSCTDRNEVIRLSKTIDKISPYNGQVRIIEITEKQYENMKILGSEQKPKKERRYNQLELF